MKKFLEHFLLLDLMLFGAHLALCPLAPIHEDGLSHRLRRAPQPLRFFRCEVTLDGWNRFRGAKVYIGRFPPHRIKELAFISFLRQGN